MLIANSNLVPHWATWDHFNELDKKGLMMYGQMTAGSWIYIGTQGIVQGTYETFAEMGRQHYDGDLRGRWILTAGLGGMGGAQPLAAVMAGAHCIAIECQESRIEKRLETRYLDRRATSIDEALDMLRESPVPISVGLLGNAAEILPEMVKRGIRPDALTDQTSAHDPVNGYLPIGWTVEQWIEMREKRPQGGRESGPRLDGRPCRGDARLSGHGRADLRLWQQHPPGRQGRGRRRTPSISPASCRPMCGRSSAAASARSAGARCRATRRTSTGPTPR